MTESEWNSCTEPQKLLDWVRQQGKLSDRKARLFVAAVCRRIWPLLTDERSRRAIEVLEQSADNAARLEELQAAAGAAAAVSDLDAYRAAHAVLFGANYGEEPLPVEAADYAAWATIDDAATEVTEAAVAAERSAQAHILRDVFGSFPVGSLPAIDACLLTPTVVTLAQRAYEDRLLPSGNFKPENLAALAAALEAAGCRDAQLLSHLRDAGLHVRGCHALDLIPGRE